MLKSYLKKIFEIADQGDAREESYYATLERLLNEWAESSGNKTIETQKDIDTIYSETEKALIEF
jgi:hypothetical protein